MFEVPRRQKGRNLAAMPSRVMMTSFAGIIAAGTLLLMLPFSSRAGKLTPFLDALFTATSATCVTGLAVYDTYQYWSPFGQTVILCLIQLGGLGLLTFTAFFNLLLGRKIGLRGMQVASESVSSESLAELPGMLRLTVGLSLCMEAAGALLLCCVFVPQYGGAEGMALSVFLSISAFCNAGFDLLGREAPFQSLTAYGNNPVVLGTIMALIILGGLGSMVWRDLLELRPVRDPAKRRDRRLEVHTQIVLLMTGILIAAGAFLFLLTEWSNPRTLGALSVPERLGAALFQSVSFRTAGFNTVDISSMREVTKIMAGVLMFIGAAPGSTGGGVKVTALAVIVMTVVCLVRGKEDTVILGRRVSKHTVYRALTVVIIGLGMVGFTTLVLTTTNRITDVGLTGIDALFEAVSAFATVGLSAGVTGVAGTASKLVLALTMFVGRVGPVSVLFSLALRTGGKRKEVLPDGKIYL